MIITLIGLSIYLTSYTFTYAKGVWKRGNKKAGLAIFLLSGTFLPLSLILALR